MPDPSSQNPSSPDTPSLTLFDSVCIIVGTIIGAGIFKMPAVVSAYIPTAGGIYLVWGLGGLIALIGALCYAELTTTYPDQGGDYGYLKRVIHRRLGFAFSWAAFWVIRPGNIAAMAIIFGEFAVQILPGIGSPRDFSIASLILISGANLLGMVFGKTIQNVLTVAKVAGILLIIIAALSINNNDSVVSEALQPPTAQVTENSLTPENSISTTTDSSLEKPATDFQWGSFWLAMVFVMFAYGGWNDIAFVATEVQHPNRNLFRALVWGTLGVTAIYLLVNFALIHSLGFQTMADIGKAGGNPTTELFDRHFGPTGLAFFAGLVCVSCLGSINAMIFTSPRIYWATSLDYPSLKWLSGSRNSRHGWWRSMLLQAIVTLILIVIFGNRQDGIEGLVAATAPYFWIFLALVIVSMMIGRVRFSEVFSGYRVPWYPMLPLIFLSACLFMVYQCWNYAVSNQLWPLMLGFGLWILLGTGISFFLQGKKQE